MASITLYCRYPDSPETLFPWTKSELVIGRPDSTKPDLDLTPDLRVSRRHARLYYLPDGWWIEDTESKYGTLVNQERVTGRRALAAGDVITCGDTTLRVAFHEDPRATPAGMRAEILADEAQPGAGIAEDVRLKLLTHVTEIALYSQTRQAMVEGFLREVRLAFPRAQRCTLLLVENGELVPRIFWPPAKAEVSFTMARQAIAEGKALQYTPRSALARGAIPRSLVHVESALYAPMLSQGRALGVLHIDTLSSPDSFAASDLQLLNLLAHTIGLALMSLGADDLPRLPAVFVSYAREDGDWVRRLAEDLRRRHVKVWFDERLKVGEDWRRQLEKAIKTMDGLLLVLSPDSLASEYVRWELDLAREARLSILPLMYRPCTPPGTIAELHYIALCGDYDAGIARLVDRLNEPTFRRARPKNRSSSGKG